MCAQGATMSKITQRAIDALPSGREVWLWDSALPGFGVRSQASGRATYVVRYRYQGQGRKATVGRCCDMAPDQAREIARGMFAQVAAGKDPARRSEGVNMAQLWERYVREYGKPYLKPSSLKRNELLWRLHISPRIGTMPCAAVTRSEAATLHASMMSSPVSANRAVALLSKMFNLADLWGYVPGGHNPARRVRKYKEQIRERVLGRDEIARLLEEAGRYDWRMELLARLLLLTGCRLSEIAKARMEWVDWNRGMLRLPDSKTGGRTVELSAEALELLEGRRGCEWMVPGRTERNHTTGMYSGWRMVCRRAGLDGLRWHDLRHTVGSLAHQSGMSLRQVAHVLGHKQLSTTERYVHGTSSAAAVAAAVGLQRPSGPSGP